MNQFTPQSCFAKACDSPSNSIRAKNAKLPHRPSARTTAQLKRTLRWSWECGTTCGTENPHELRTRIGLLVGFDASLTALRNSDPSPESMYEINPRNSANYETRMISLIPALNSKPADKHCRLLSAIRSLLSLPSGFYILHFRALGHAFSTLLEHYGFSTGVF